MDLSVLASLPVLGHSPTPDRLSRMNGQTVWRGVCIGLLVVGSVMAMTIPVAAVIDRLTHLPVGAGQATIEWTGRSGVSPTVNSVSGHIGTYSLSATDRVSLPQLGDPQAGSSRSTSSPSIPTTFPFGDVEGTIGGTSFRLHITLKVPTSLPSQGTFTLGTVTGSFRGEPVNGLLTASSSSNTFDVHGTIGSYHVSVTIQQPHHHGNRSVAHASYVVTK